MKPRRNQLLVGLKARLQRLLEGHGLGGDDVHQGAALDTGEHRAVQLVFLGELLAGEDQSAPGAPEGLVCGGGGDVGVGDGAGVEACRHQARDVGDVRHQESAALVGNLPEALEVDGPGVGAGSGDD